MANYMAMRTLLFVVAVAMAFGLGMSQNVESQSCSSKLANLNVCAPFVVPGNSAEPHPPVNDACCGALRAVDEGCLCSTLRIANRLPTLCNLTPVSCIQ